MAQMVSMVAGRPLMQLDNVLLDGSQPLPIIKMCDFGYSKDEVAGSLCKTACGTPEYMAPEVPPPPPPPNHTP